MVVDGGGTTGGYRLVLDGGNDNACVSSAKDLLLLLPYSLISRVEPSFRRKLGGICPF